MDRTEAENRDRVLHAFFEGKVWDRNDEFLLKRSLVLNRSELLPTFPFVVDDEWDVVPGKTDQGRGDLVFTDGAGCFAVVEVKFIDLGRSGPTARSKRTGSRKKVVEQAMDYAHLLYARHGADAKVEAFSFTNERTKPVSEGIISGEVRSSPTYELPDVALPPESH